MTHAADFLDSRVRGALHHQGRQPSHATSHGLSAALLRVIAEHVRLGGEVSDVRHSLTVVEIAMDDLDKGLHLPDEDAIEGRVIPYSDPSVGASAS